MDFDFNEDQRALADTVQRFVTKDYTFEKRRAILDSGAGWSRTVWRELADLGVLALTIDEDHGGLGYGPQETGLVMGAFGAGLLLEPYLASAVIAPALIRRIASADSQAEWLPRIAAGESIVILAHADARGEMVTEKSGKLNGRKAVVTHGACADLLLVSARTADGDTGLFAVTPDAEGVSLRDYPTLDGQRAADLVLSNAPAWKVGAGDTANAIDAALDIGLAALCSEAVGVMEATVAATTDYLKTRQQFGQPIGRFQALQHRMADMLLHLEQARSMSYLAAMHCTSEDASARRRSLSAAKVTIGQACRFIAQNAVQLHGGMGMTDELMLSHWFKRLTAIEMSFGDTDAHLQRFARLSRAA
ncbi:acyl-CoA dehydrogenase family protein [Sulfuritalea hydrogenivorans]|uniref:Acyl-CoA dehydrogenase n=1 Tax=Sulfuritalea hydrogenivorans sk43H TaxID=1223802 RepID=W0SJB4_9PROT|nr:acyl-CoA dehydrogenase [Sulfuritalea hydrogenivorans]BAO30128.1 acyl-CoA dehydrogenase [Sulfuritalea hydrogenivorans sk43H]